MQVLKVSLIVSSRFNIFTYSIEGRIFRRTTPPPVIEFFHIKRQGQTFFPLKYVLIQIQIFYSLLNQLQGWGQKGNLKNICTARIFKQKVFSFGKDALKTNNNLVKRSITI
jgi:hypothetical protein